MLHSLLLGVGLGAFVAAQIGPISLLLVRVTLRGSVAAGLAIGVGAATVDACYAALGVAGVAPLLAVEPVRLLLGLAGAAVLVALGARTLWSAWRVRLGGETAAEVASPGRAYVTSLVATASNPLTIVSWAAIFAAATTAGAAASLGGAVLLVAGIALGSLGWFTALAGGVALVRRRMGERVLAAVDVVAGLGLMVFGVLLGTRTVAESRP